MEGGAITPHPLPHSAFITLHSAFDSTLPDPRPIVLFDGVCNLCDASVHFVIDRDPAGRFAFAPLQSKTGQALAARFGLAGPELTSVILIEGDRCHTRSTAALRIARRLTWPWPVLYGLVVVPRLLRDFAYDWVAGNRYRWFGTRDACRLPTPQLAGRFVDE